MKVQHCVIFHVTSFDVTSLFTNVLLHQTIDTILEQIYNGKPINTKLPNNILKNLIKDCCIKTAFSFNGFIRKRKDGVSMASSLVPVIANIIMAELERVNAEPLIIPGKSFYTIC